MSTCNLHGERRGQRPEAGATTLKPHNAGRQRVNDFIALIQSSSVVPLKLCLRKLSDLETNHNLKLGRKQNLGKMATFFEHFILANGGKVSEFPSAYNDY